MTPPNTTGAQALNPLAGLHGFLLSCAAKADNNSDAQVIRDWAREITTLAGREQAGAVAVVPRGVYGPNDGRSGELYGDADWIAQNYEAVLQFLERSVAAAGSAIAAHEQEAEAFLRQMTSLPGTIIRSSRDLTPQATTNARSSSKWLTLRVGLGFAIMEEHARQATEDEQSPCAKCSSPSDCGRLGCAALASPSGAVASNEAVREAIKQAIMGYRVKAGHAMNIENFADAITPLFYSMRSATVKATPSEALSPATVAQPVAYVNGDELDNMLDDRTAVIQQTRSGFRKTALYLAALPCASQGCGGAVSEGALQAAHRLGFLRAAGWMQKDSLFSDVNTATYRKDRDHDLAALSTAPEQSAKGLTMGGEQ